MMTKTFKIPDVVGHNNGRAQKARKVYALARKKDRNQEASGTVTSGAEPSVGPTICFDA